MLVQFSYMESCQQNAQCMWLAVFAVPMTAAGKQATRNIYKQLTCIPDPKEGNQFVTWSMAPPQKSLQNSCKQDVVSPPLGAALSIAMLCNFVHL